jgi:4-hydroxyphenylpyruvate dioxygenase
LGKVERYLEQHNVDDLKLLLGGHGLSAPVASYQGGLLATQGDARREHWGHFARRLELCQKLGVGTLVVAADVHDPLDSQLISRVQASLKQMAAEAAARSVKIALEFQAGSRFCNNLETAAALVAETGSANLGICLDVFHYFMGPSKFDDLAYLTSGNLFHVQLCDVAGVARELAADADRILPGDGDFPLQPIVEHLKQMGYQGCVSLELMNPEIWTTPPAQVGEIGMTALRAVLGQSSMG